MRKPIYVPPPKPDFFTVGHVLLVFALGIGIKLFPPAFSDQVTLSKAPAVTARMTLAPTAIPTISPTPADTAVPADTPMPAAVTMTDLDAAESTEYTYVLNTSSKRFHIPSCKSAVTMKEKNRDTFTGSREELLSMGYVPCGNCDP